MRAAQTAAADAAAERAVAQAQLDAAAAFTAALQDDLAAARAEAADERARDVATSGHLLEAQKALAAAMEDHRAAAARLTAEGAARAAAEERRDALAAAQAALDARCADAERARRVAEADAAAQGAQREAVATRCASAASCCDCGARVGAALPFVGARFALSGGPRSASGRLFERSQAALAATGTVFQGGWAGRLSGRGALRAGTARRCSACCNKDAASQPLFCVCRHGEAVAALEEDVRAARAEAASHAAKAAGAAAEVAQLKAALQVRRFCSTLTHKHMNGGCAAQGGCPPRHSSLLCRAFIRALHRGRPPRGLAALLLVLASALPYPWVSLSRGGTLTHTRI